MKLTQLLQDAPGPLTAIGIFGGFGLIVTGNPILAAIGAVLIMGGLLVPFLRLAPPAERDVRPERVGDPTEPARRDVQNPTRPPHRPARRPTRS